jgi:two-component system chemotaxis response regulator CheY
MKILVVDDSQIMRNLIIKQMNQIVFPDIDEAVDGVEATRKISMNQYDAISLDILMPKIDGSSVVKHIKEVSPATIIIMCSSINDPETIKSLIKLGIHDFILKPFTIEKLQEVLQRNLMGGHNG